ncbi:restriction endonuclease subunit S, partial [Sphingobacterium daejeonense]|uniref:restriction endonuclease subunit S n=1 Tax=Sphingobacterium daejeonense TaxID=371142 RepID=UPI003D312E4F
AENLKLQEDDLENEIETYFLNQLGIRKNMSSNFSKGFRIIEYKNLDRWDANVVSELTSTYKIEKIGSYVLKIATGTTPPTNISEYFNGDINFYTPSDLGEVMYLNSASRKVSELSLLEKKARRFEKGTILFVGIGSTVGKVGIVNNDYATSNQQITGFNIDTRFLLDEYVYFYFYYLRDITVKEQTKATLPIVNQNKIINIPIPIPPISKQQEIIKEILKMKNKKLVFETERKKLLIEAHQEFEQTIFR